MKNKYLNDYQGYIQDIISIYINNEKKKKWIEQELKNKVPWYIKIINILGCIDYMNILNLLKTNWKKYIF